MLRRLAPFLLVIAGCTPSPPPPSATLWQGLPHPVHAQHAFEVARATGQAIAIDDQWFTPSPQPLDPAITRRVQAALAIPGVLTPWHVDKKCGGFHADYAVELGPVTWLFCFGCGEVKRLEAGEVTRYDLDHDLRDQFQTLFTRISSDHPG